MKNLFKSLFVVLALACAVNAHGGYYYRRHHHGHGGAYAGAAIGGLALGTMLGAASSRAPRDPEVSRINAIRAQMKENNRRINRLRKQLRRASDDERQSIQDEIDALREENKSLAESL